MNLRLLEIDTSNTQQDQVLALLKAFPCLDVWQSSGSEQISIRVTLPTTQVEAVLNQLREHLPELGNPRVMILPIETMWPMPDLDAPCNQATARLSREEIYTNVAQPLQLSWTQLGMVTLSTLIAAIGLLKSSEAIIIGAMVLAPLLQPILGVAVAAVLGDSVLAKRSIKIGSISIGLALGLSILLGLVFPISTDLPEIMARVSVGPLDVGLAIAAGIASALSLTTDNQNAIVGVMVAVALLPPLVVLGLLLGSGEWTLAPGALLLVVTNIIGLNLAATTTLMAQNIQPQSQRWQAQHYTQWVIGIGMVFVLGIMSMVTWQHSSILGAFLQRI